MVMINVGSPKMAREHIALLQQAVAFGKVEIQVDQAPMMSPIYKMLSDMLRQLDEHRPLGVDGKHGDLHTATCGCEDNVVGVRTVYITGHEQAQVETTVWTDDSVTYRHRRREHRISGSYWGEWEEGKN